jgi:hypothetical protein
MNIKFKVKNTNYIVTSDSMNFILKVEGNPKLTTYYSTIGGVLESLYQMGLKENNVTTFRELAKHSEEIRDLVGRVELQLKQVNVKE